MDEELRQKLAALEVKVDAAYASAEKTRKYILWMMIISIAVIVLPAIGLVFAIPSFLSTLSGYSELMNIQ